MSDTYPTPTQHLEREVNIDVLTWLDLSQVTQDAIHSALQDPSNLVQHSEGIHQVPHKQQFMPTLLNHAVQGTRFAHLDLQVDYATQGNEATEPHLTIAAQDRHISGRTVTFDQDQAGDFRLSDTHEDLNTLRGRKIAERIEGSEVARWLATHVLGSASGTMSFLDTYGYDAAIAAARQLEIYASGKDKVDATVAFFPNGNELIVQQVSHYNSFVTDPTLVGRYYSAVLRHRYVGDIAPRNMKWLEECLVVEFCPEKGVVHSLDDPEVTSVRVTLEAPRNVDSRIMGRLLAERAVNAEDKVLDMFKKIGAMLTPVRP